jgi:hypothetical protein
VFADCPNTDPTGCPKVVCPNAGKDDCPNAGGVDVPPLPDALPKENENDFGASGLVGSTAIDAGALNEKAGAAANVNGFGVAAVVDASVASSETGLAGGGVEAALKETSGTAPDDDPNADGAAAEPNEKLNDGFFSAAVKLSDSLTEAAAVENENAGVDVLEPNVKPVGDFCSAVVEDGA